MTEVEPIESASTIDSSFYSDGQIHRDLAETVFARSWQFAGGTPPEDSARPLILLPGMLDEPLVLVGRNCHSNVCTHRGNLVVLDEGPVSTLRCGYHGRCFRPDGAFVSMPGFEGVENFPSAGDDLAGVRCEQLGPWSLVSLDPLVDSPSWLGRLAEDGRSFPWDRLAVDPDRSPRFEIDANWALYCENYLEGFHVPFVHPGLRESLDLSGYRTETFEWGCVQIGPAKADGAHVPGHPGIAGLYYWFFPNLMLNVYPWGISVNVVDPLAVDRTRIRFESWVWDESRLELGAGSDLGQVEMEDEEVVLQVARGVRSRFYRRGRYSPRHEIGTWHFHNILRKALARPNL